LAIFYTLRERRRVPDPESPKIYSVDNPALEPSGFGRLDVNPRLTAGFFF
jgi:hypothetical protein